MELLKNLRIDSVKRLNPTPPRHVAPTDPVAKAAGVMKEHRVGCVLVCTESRIVGIFTERDLLRRVLAAGLPLTTAVQEVMTPDPVTVQPGEAVGVAVARMEEGGYRHLPVVDAEGRPQGILSARRIVHYLVEHYNLTVYNQPPDPSSVPEAPEGA